jgi:hypothetical protein
VAIGTDDRAFDEFLLDSADRRPAADHVGHISAFLMQVVELKDTEIRVAAIRTVLSS